jgi:hypothetical protein
MNLNPKKVAALAALRGAVKAKAEYWDAMNALEQAFGFDSGNIPDATSDEMVSQVENLASCTDDDNTDWIDDGVLETFMTSCEVYL